LGLATGLIHLVVLNLLMGQLDILFTLNGLGYLALIATFFFNPPIIAGRRRQLSLLLIGYTAVTILAWVFMGDRGPLGIATKVIEVLLIVALVMDMRSVRAA
jgi:hypothetical protein